MPGDRHKQVPFSLFDDTVPEDLETFAIELREVAGGAEIDGDSDSLSVSILSNDNAHGVIEFSQVLRVCHTIHGIVIFLMLLTDSVVSMIQDSVQRLVVEEQYGTVIQLNLERSAGSFGGVVISWTISATGGFAEDITPTQGQVGSQPTIELFI